jgi:hypothetical protein
MRRAVVVLVTIGGLAAGRRADATTREVIPLPIRIYDSSGLAPREMEAARKTVHTAFRKAGLNAQWLDCSRPASATPSLCMQAVGRAEIVVRIVRTPSKRSDPVLGYAEVFEPGGGTLATVLAEGVDEMARTSRIDSGTLIGRVIVHEVSHLLAGTSDHSPNGLMRGTWSDLEIRRNNAIDWSLSRRDVQQVRLGLLARSSPPLESDPSPTRE